ncbi:MAG: hypothetical protein CVU44_23050 [Chloroflexi bacterium HGW-Chloroflexi-6]|nr:MAG: hypothetical protein CVU44_23050 [Chloroflexi bacterium HGW-Chloroflexi-6]
MRTIRRVYFYAVALISLEVVLWGMISLLRTMFAQDVIFPTADTLAQALALILVGVPIFLIHWLWTQRTTASDSEEQTATVRAVFFYLVLLFTLMPVVQNLLALIDRTFIETVRLDRASALFGGSQSWVDNLIAILMNGVAAAYFWNLLRGIWVSLKDRENFADVRRLYRYIWLAYGLLMVVFGAQQVLRFLFFLPDNTILGASGNELAINGIALLLVGAPVWLYTWKTCQDALEDVLEQTSNLRLGVLYLLSLSGVVVVLSSAGILLDIVLRIVLGEASSMAQFLQKVGTPLSIGIPLGLVWAYYGGWFQREAQSNREPGRQAGVKRLYYYVLSPIGLAATVTGLALLISFLIDALLLPGVVWGETLRPRLSGALATLLVGLPLWLMAWRPMQAESLSDGEVGDRARQSIVRRVYLYAVIFAAVIGGMISAVVLAFMLLNAVLSGDVPDDFLASTLNALQVLLLFAGLLIYHIATLRKDGSRATDSLSARYRDFAVLVFEHEESGFGRRLTEALSRQASALPVAVQAVEQPIPDGAESARVVALPADLALNPPEALRLWLNAYQGQRVVAPSASSGWWWAGSVSAHPEIQAAQIIRQLADGETPRQSAGLPAWTVVAYVFAILFALQVVFILLSLGISLVAGF